MRNLESKVRAGVSAFVLAAAALAMTASAHAQSTMLRVDIPFAFDNGSKQLPAGRYTMEINSGSHILEIRGRSTSGLALVMSEENKQTATTGKVVFHRYGDHYFLKEVWAPGSTSHVRTSRSAAEKHLQLAQNKPADNGVEVALLEPLR